MHRTYMRSHQKYMDSEIFPTLGPLIRNLSHLYIMYVVHKYSVVYTQMLVSRHVCLIQLLSRHLIQALHGNVTSAFYATFSTEYSRPACMRWYVNSAIVGFTFSPSSWHIIPAQVCAIVTVMVFLEIWKQRTSTLTRLHSLVSCG